MSNFKVEVYNVTMVPHPNADKVELACIGDFRSVSMKGIYETGDRVAYIPEGAVVPETVLKLINFWNEENQKGDLDGTNGDRVKCRKLRGVLSQGIIFKAKDEWAIGQDVAAEMGITRYEPPIPDCLKGEVGSTHVNFKFEIDNIKKFPDVIKEGEEVVMTEKIHGTLTTFGLIPEGDRKADMVDGAFFVSSKILAHKGMYFQDVEKNNGNTYVGAFKKYDVGTKMKAYFKESDQPIWLVGEAFGMQKNSIKFYYGTKESGHGFRAYGIKLDGVWLNEDEFQAACKTMDIPVVPVLYRGPFSKEKLAEVTSGRETVSGKEQHIREGCVVTPVIGRIDMALGRVILKSVSEKYLLKTDGQEYS